MTAITLTLAPIGPLIRDTFQQLCRANPDAKFERTAQGELIIMSPTGGDSGRRNAYIAIDLGLWNRQTQRGHSPWLCARFSALRLMLADKARCCG
ncbi:MAG: Uma2 family endonuclease [Elainellaceae cyanobacterium]